MFARSPSDRFARVSVRLLILILIGCGTKKDSLDRPPVQAPAQALEDKVPVDKLNEVVAAHYKGVAAMDRFLYGDAVKAFQEVHRLAPGWIPGSINLAIAMLNAAGEAIADEKQGKKKEGEAVAAGKMNERALDLLAEVLKRDPKNPYAHYCRGLILNEEGRIPEAHREFQTVTELDPKDGHAWLWRGVTVTDTDEKGEPIEVDIVKEQDRCYGKALEANPFLTFANYRLAIVKSQLGNAEARDRLLAFWNKINPQGNPAAPGEGYETVYGEMGRYATIIDPRFLRESRRAEKVRPPRFQAPKAIEVRLSEGTRWASETDFQKSTLARLIGRARARFGAPVVCFDADNDGKLDLYLPAAAVGPKGLKDLLLLNRGDGSFQDASQSFGIADDRPSLGAAAADFDADRFVDLFLARPGDNRLLRNVVGKKFEDATKFLPETGPKGLALTARWLDLDQDGDLDLFVLNHCAAEDAEAALTDKPPAGLANLLYRNDGVPSPVDPKTPRGNWTPIATAPPNVKAKGGLSIKFSAWTGREVEALLDAGKRHTATAQFDIDDDRDLDLILGADGSPTVAVLNDRLGRFHAEPPRLPEGRTGDSLNGLLTTDLDLDGLIDWVSLGGGEGGRVSLFRNAYDRRAERPAPAFDRWPIDARGWRSAAAVDLDLDGRADLLALPAEDSPAPIWARSESNRFVAGPPLIGPGSKPIVGLACVNLAGDPLPDLFLIGDDGEPPRIAKNLGNGAHWLALDFAGRWAGPKVQMRSNPHGLGIKLELKGQGIDVDYLHTTGSSGLGQSVAPVVLGLGSKINVPDMGMRWPDGILQGEMNVPADHAMLLEETNRKPSSCPVVFTWNGERFVCLGDFLGGGGLGYLLAPGVWSRPDRDESLLIGDDQLRPQNGRYLVSITEPMDELSYLDQVRLDVIDAPPGVSVGLDERFAPEPPRPTGEPIAWRETIEPRRATDLDGNDLTETLRRFDRDAADGFRLLGLWPGYAEEHGVVLDFGDRLSRYGPDDELTLCIAGWVEYPFSQTNYAASTAGVVLTPPVLERMRPDGSWRVVRTSAGYPAGMPRRMTLPLKGELTGKSCTLRLRTNMECYFDQINLVVRDRASESRLKIASLPPARATLGYRGFTREVEPDGKPPITYDYNYVDPAPLASLSGNLTRFGDVLDLLSADDDRLCLVGPGDEARIEFDAARVPPPPPGHTRFFVLRGIGYCKDADPFTATSDTIEPLPWKKMGDGPPEASRTRPLDRAYRDYLRTYQTRPAESR